MYRLAPVIFPALNRKGSLGEHKHGIVVHVLKGNNSMAIKLF